MNRDELIELVRRILNVEGTEEEIDSMVIRFQEAVPHPAASDLILYPERQMTPEEIVEEALSYKPIALS